MIFEQRANIRGEHVDAWRVASSIRYTQSRGVGDLLLDQIVKQRVALARIRCELSLRGAAAGRACVRLLVGLEVGRSHETVLDVVDPKVGGFTKRHRTQMAGKLQSVPVRSLDGGAQFCARQVCISL